MKFRLVSALAAILMAGFWVFVPGVGSHPAHAVYFGGIAQEQEDLLSGFASYELNPANATNGSSEQVKSYFPTGSGTCSEVTSSNVRVNQECTNVSNPDLAGRGQAQNETTIAINPNNTNQLIAGSNDYRRGDGNCYAEYSLDKGRTWNTSTVPMSFTRGSAFGASRQYWQAGGDPSVAWDTKGNAYYTCQMFNRGAPTSSNPDLSSAVYVFRSTHNSGASWDFPGRPIVEMNDVQGSGIVGLEDKPYMTIDNHVGSPYQDRIYVTWTAFNFTTGSAYIFESYSSDYGQTFSSPHLVSVNVPTLCANTYGLGTEQGNCNENQFSDPFTGPDGALYVVYDNYNNLIAKGSSDDRNQILISKSTDGGNTFVGPIKVSDYYDLPDCAAYQGGKDFGRACVPEKGASTNSYFRAVNYPTGAVNPANASQVVVTFGSYINKFSNEANGCVPAGFNPATGNNEYTGVKTPGACNNKILESVSNDGGVTFTGTASDPRVETTVNQDPGQVGTDQFWQWEAFTKNGKLAVSYYDREYGADETTGYSDVSLSGSGDLVNFVVDRVTSSSMPFPTEFSGLFYGDYSGLAAYDNAYPLWMDTRNPELFVCPTPVSTTPALCTGQDQNANALNDQDIYTAALPVPSK